MTVQRIVVSGRVQGVGYRDWVVRAAQRGRLIGFVRNLRDGRVELIASGSDEALAELIEACHQGPPLARVEHVETAPAELDKSVKGFTKRFTA